MDKPAQQIVAGDTFLHEGHGWTALEDAVQLSSGNILVKVRIIPDGGHTYREWIPGSVVPHINEEHGE